MNKRGKSAAGSGRYGKGNKHDTAPVENRKENKHGAAPVEAVKGSKRGAAVVEAVIVYPIIIISMMTVLYLLIALYSTAASAAELHTALREEAGNESETVLAENFPRHAVTLRKESGVLYDRIAGECSDTAQARGLIRLFLRRNYRDTIRVMDEERYIRCLDATAGIINEAV